MRRIDVRNRLDIGEWKKEGMRVRFQSNRSPEDRHLDFRLMHRLATVGITNFSIQVCRKVHTTFIIYKALRRLVHTSAVEEPTFTDLEPENVNQDDVVD